eukprot:9224793-Alexandrium_andersonii.AAC.1
MQWDIGRIRGMVGHVWTQWNNAGRYGAQWDTARWTLWDTFGHDRCNRISWDAEGPCAARRNGVGHGAARWDTVGHSRAWWGMVENGGAKRARWDM